MNLEAHTLRYGTHEWMEMCAASVDAWVKKHDLPLYIWGDQFRQYPCAKFGVIEMLRRFLDRGATHFMYVDADVYVNPHAPVPPLLDGLTVPFDIPLQGGVSRWLEWRDWCSANFGVTPEPTYEFSNAGVWICDRAAAEALLAIAQPPYIERVQEQHQWNMWVYQVATAGTLLRRLPRIWNRYGLDPGPAWFFHFLGNDKTTDIETLKASGYLTNHNVPDAPNYLL